MINKLLLYVFILEFLSCSPKEKSKENKQQLRPNIIYILADDLGYGDLGCYGQKMIKTPNIDKLAEEGVRFTAHYAGSTVCAPSRSVLMTGLHTGHTTVRGNDEGRSLLASDTTVAALLKNAGYTTGMIGKWGLGEMDTPGNPLKQGFDYYFGYLNQIRAHNYYPEWLLRNDDTVHLDNVVEYEKEGYAKGLGGVSTTRIDYSHDLFIDDALGFLEKNREQPFFLYLALTIPHANNEGGGGGMEVPTDEPYTNEDWPQVEKNFAAMITGMDSDVGKIMDKLRDLNLDDNTIVMFTSDNGPHSEGGHDPDFFDSNGIYRGKKRDLYDGGIRVPLIVRWPNHIESGSTSTHVSAFWDVLPTLCELGGAEINQKTDGISFLPSLLKQPQQEHQSLYFEFFEGSGSQAVIRDGWKCIRLNVLVPENQRVELYNLDKDPSEENNLADQFPEKVEELTNLMESSREEDSFYKL